MKPYIRPSIQNNTAPVYQTPNLGQNLQQNSQVRGAYGQWGNNPNQTYNQIPSPQNISNPQNQNPANNLPNPATNPNIPPNNNAPIGFYGQPQNQNIRSGYAPIGAFRQPPNINPQINPNQNFQNRPPAQFSQNGNVVGNPFFVGQRPSVNQSVYYDQNLAQKEMKQLEYLQKTSPTALRKMAIKEQVAIQRTLLQAEKEYRKGVSTIRDLIAPSSVKITTGYMELGTKLVRSFFILVYPRVISAGWLEGLVNTDLPIDISIFIYPKDSGKVLQDLRGKVGKIQASIRLNDEKGAPRDPALETAYRDVEGLRDAIQQGVEKFFAVGVYITIYADTKEELEKLSKSVEGILNQQNIILKRAAMQMDDGFNSSLPILKDDLQVHINMNTSPLSASFPFVSSELSSDSGILYGINRHNSSLIIFDRFELENANEVVFATSGAGKSYTVKLEILRSLMVGINVIVIDPEQEYKILADTLGGTYVNMSLNSNNRINPFDLPKALPGESNADILRTSIIDLMGLMNLMLGKLNPQEVSIMERAIKEAYAKRDITEESDFSKLLPPTMQDLVEILQGVVGGETLAQRLYRYTEGTFAGIFNKRTNININNSFVVFNIRDLQEDLRPIAMYILLKYVWNEIRSELKRRILAIDEAWIMMQYEDSARFLYGLVKRARKYYLGVTTITQDVGDFLNSPFGKPIVTNSALKTLLKQSTASIDLIGETFALTAGEKQVLLQSSVGQGIFFAGPRHVAIEVIAFPTEHRIITTNPKDLLKMQEFAANQQ
jgi:conjugal transfer ATP-binding protein TraC